MRDADVPALAALLSRAYREYQSSAEKMAMRLRTAIAFRVQSFVAEDGGAPVGMVLAYDYGSTSFVALMGVEPDRQRGGVGNALMGALCAWLDERKLPSELYATAEGHGLYRKFGFEDRGEAGVWYGRGPAPGRETAGVRPATAADRDAIAALDREAFGADRGVTFRAALEQSSNVVFVAADGRGFAISQCAAKALGPVVAPDDATAGRLFRAAAAALGDGEHRVNAPVRDDVERMLRDAGYRRDRTATRMIRGAVPEGRRERIRVVLSLGQG